MVRPSQGDDRPPPGRDGCGRWVTWVPSERNPSKLVMHRWDGVRWVETVHVRFVPWQEPCGGR